MHAPPLSRSAVDSTAETLPATIASPGFRRLLHYQPPMHRSPSRVPYINVSPLGVPQVVLAVNGKFPCPLVNVTTNYNVIINVFNELDEDLLMTWPGIQMKRNSWQDGVLGTNCPIPPKWNWTC